MGAESQQIKLERGQQNLDEINENCVAMETNESMNLDDQEWTERLLRINGNLSKLKHKSLNENRTSTSEFEFEGGVLKIDERIQIEPSRLNGEIFSWGEEEAKKLMYVSKGGMAEVTIPGTQSQKAQMLTINIVIPQEEEAEIFFMLNEPVEINWRNGYRTELEYGKYAKMAGDSKGIMYFQEARMYYKDKLVKENTNIECDENGLRFDGRDTLDYEELSSGGILQKAEMVFDSQGMHVNVFDSVIIKINGEEVKLDYKKRKGETSIAFQYQFGAEGVELQNGFVLYLSDAGAVVKEGTDFFQKEKKVSLISYRKAKATYKVPNLHDEKERAVNVELLSVQATENGEAQIEFAFPQNDALMIPLSKNEHSFFMMLKKGRFEGKGKEVRFLDSEIYYKGKLYTQVKEMLGDENGLHLPEGVELELDKSAFDKEIVSEEEWEDFDDEEAEMKLFLKFDKKALQIDVKKNVIYRTLDNFGKIKNINKTEEDQEIGDLYLSEIPLIFVDKQQNDKKIRKLEAREEAIESVSITEVRENRKVFNAKKEEPINVTYDVMEVELETGSGTIQYKKTITLENLEIKDGNLVVEKVIIENEAGRDQASEDEAKEIFNCTVTGSIIQTSKWADFTKEGLRMEVGKPTLGKVSLDGFLGFLSGEVDYPEGRLRVEASNKKEAEAKPILELEKEKGIDFRLLIPGTMGALKAKFGIYPTAEIGGSVEVNANRHKSFGEKWGVGDKLSLGGEIGIDGSAGITAEAGLEAGFSYLANIDLVLSASLIAELAAHLAIASQLMYVEKAEKDNKRKHLEQADNLAFKGEIGATLNGVVSLGSNARFLFWKKNLFELELYNETLGEMRVAIEAEKDKDSHNFTQGWKLLNKEGFAKGLSRSVNLNFKRKDIQAQERTKVVKDAKNGAEQAWAALVEIEKNRESTAIILKEEEKNKLDPQIDQMKKEATEKINAYLEVLEKEQKRLTDVLKELKNTLQIDKAELIRLKTLIDENERGNEEVPEELKNSRFNQMAMWGGFSRKSYGANVPREMMVVDYLIARTLGEVSRENLGNIVKDITKWSRGNSRKLNWNEKDYVKDFMEKTAFSEHADTIPDAYQEYISYYGMLNAKTIVEKKRTQKGVPEPYKVITNNNPNITNKELLKIALEDRYVDDNGASQEIRATAAEKMALFEFCFIVPKSNKGRAMGTKGKEEAKKAWIETMNQELKQQTGDENITMEKAAKKISQQNLYRLIEPIPKQIEDTNQRIESTKKRQAEVEKQLRDIPGIVSDYQKKLESMKSNAELAFETEGFNPEAAKNALNIYSESYLGKIKETSERLDKTKQKLEQERNKLEATRDKNVPLDTVALPPLLTV